MKKLFAVLALLSGALLAGTAAFCAQPQAGAQKLSFPNGFRMIVKPEPGKGLVALCMVIRAGALEEEDTPGMGQLLSRTLFTGARSLSQRKLAQLSDEVGGSFSVLWDPDYTEVYIATTSDQLGAAMELLSEVLISPRFDDATVTGARNALQQEIKTAREGAFRASYDELRRLLYSGSPYRAPLLGTEASTASLTAEDMRRFVAKWFVPGNMVLAVVGDVTVEQTQDAARLWFGKQDPKAVPQRRPVPDEAGPVAPPSVIEVPSGAGYVVAGGLAAGLGSPRYAPDMVAATVLGGGKSSRMFRRMREGEALAYDLGTLYPPLVYQSHVIAYALVPEDETPGDYRGGPGVEDVRAGLKRTVDSLKSEPITEAELKRAKRYLIGTFALRHERLQERARHLAWFEAMGLGYTYDERLPGFFDGVTLDAVRDSAKRLFGRSAMVVVVPRP